MIPEDAWPAGDLLAWDEDETCTHWDFTTEPWTETPYTDEERAEVEARNAEAAAEQAAADARAALCDEVADLLALEPRPLTRTMTLIEALARLTLEMP